MDSLLFFCFVILPIFTQASIIALFFCHTPTLIMIASGGIASPMTDVLLTKALRSHRIKHFLPYEVAWDRKQMRLRYKSTASSDLPSSHR
ncbi:hypothetical protein DM02DRAFT_344960 [Periconia macrospinosa]|uniref:Uncharacterized protein n=1 Tax=Periconia macrospinosa TaxID=97972 RepID=A0A2V1DTH7_9PLEO|nr:hypothetical protein DM02DRAFT_344960 [Periconia macrospinosa]